MISRSILTTVRIGTLLVAMSAGAASLTVDTTEPNGPQVVIANPHSTFTSGTPGPLGERDTITTAFTAAGGFGARGQSFLMPDIAAGNLWDVSGITLRADANAAGAGVAQDLSATPSSLKLWVFEWNPNTVGTDGTQWTSGNGMTDGDPFDGTGISNYLINGELFDITRTFAGEFLHFQTPGLQLAENTAYGILVSLETGPDTGFRLDDIRDNVAPNGQTYPNGGILRSDASVNTLGSNGDDLVFYVEGIAAVPEPGTIALFGIGAVAVAASIRRRR